MAWTEERVETLKRLWADGLSASQIAYELGGVSRNGVIGKAHRVGLFRRDNPISSRPKTQQKKPLRVNRTLRTFFNHNTVLAQVCKNALAESDEAQGSPTVVPLEQRRSLLELTEKMCCWPVGDPQSEYFYFCGAERMSGKLGANLDASPIPYCAYHTRMAYESLATHRTRRTAA